VKNNNQEKSVVTDKQTWCK